MNEPNRREFLSAGAAAAAAICATCGLVECAEAQQRGGRGERGPSGPANGGAVGGSVDVGAITDYPKDGISDKLVKSNKLLVVRNSSKIFAITAVCTHRFAVLTVSNGALRCPKHGSEYSVYGTVTKGPAKDSLVHYAIRKNDKDRLIVDTTKPFREKDWGDPATFVEVKA